SNPRLFADCEVYEKFRATDGEGASDEEVQAFTRCGAYFTGAFDLLQFRDGGKCSLQRTPADQIIDEYLAFNRKGGGMTTHRGAIVWKVTDACHCTPDPKLPAGICRNTAATSADEAPQAPAIPVLSVQANGDRFKVEGKVMRYDEMISRARKSDVASIVV